MVARAFYRHAKIDRTLFLSSFSFERRNERKRNWTGGGRWWGWRWIGCLEREGIRDGVNIGSVRSSRVGDEFLLSLRFSSLTRRIVSDTRDLYLPPRAATFSLNWSHCPCPWDDRDLRIALTSRIQSTIQWTVRTIRQCHVTFWYLRVHSRILAYAHAQDRSSKSFSNSQKEERKKERKNIYEAVLNFRDNR